MATTINADTVTGGAIVTGDASGVLGLQSAGVTGLTISGGNATFPNSATFAGALTETVVALGTTGTLALNPANGTVQTCALSGAPTFTDSLTSGQSLVLMLTGAATYPPTFPTITWVTSGGNVAPTLTAADTLVFWKISTTLYGAYVGNYV
jgi:hypothetical protein